MASGPRWPSGSQAGLSPAHQATGQRGGRLRPLCVLPGSPRRPVFQRLRLEPRSPGLSSPCPSVGRDLREALCPTQMGSWRAPGSPRCPKRGPPPPLEPPSLGQRFCGSDHGVHRPPKALEVPHRRTAPGSEGRLSVTSVCPEGKLGPSPGGICPGPHLNPGSFGPSAHVFMHFRSVTQRPSWVHPPLQCFTR